MASLDEVIQNVIHAFGKHTRVLGQLDVGEALEEFWRMKKDASQFDSLALWNGSTIFSGGCKSRGGDESPSQSIKYKYGYVWDGLKLSDEEEDEENGEIGQGMGNSLEAPVVKFSWPKLSILSHSINVEQKMLR